MLEILGYSASIAMGCVLGLLGGGGSILTVPIMVYLFGIQAENATSWSLFVVGIAALAGSIQYIRKDLVDYRTALVFGIPSIIAVFVTQYWIAPAIPKDFFWIGETLITKGMFLLLLFATLMLLASLSMIFRKRKTTSQELERRFNIPIIILEGVGVGFLTGLVGAGGGFMIVPALVVLSRLPMKLAVGTSLLIVAFKSVIGFGGALAAAVSVDWSVLLPFTGLAIIGILIGSWLSTFIPGEKLRPVFGWFVLVMGFFVIIQTLKPGWIFAP